MMMAYSRKMLNLWLLLGSILVIPFIMGVSATGSLVRSTSRAVGIVDVPVIPRTQAKLAMGVLLYLYHTSDKDSISTTYVNNIAWSPDDSIFPFGDALGSGSLGTVHLSVPIVGMAATPDGKGYWLVAAAGGYGSLGNVHLNKLVVGISATLDGRGYWPGRPTVTRNLASDLEVFMRDQDGNIYHAWQTGANTAGWTSWYSMGTTVTHDPVVINISDGRTELFVVGQTTFIWDVTDGGNVLTSRGHTKQIYDMKWSPDGEYIASAGADGTVRVWNAFSGSTISIHRFSSTAMQAILWSPDYIPSTDTNGTLQVWDAFDRGRLFVHSHYSGSVYAVAWSPDGSGIASGDESGRIPIWLAATRTTLYNYSIGGDTLVEPAMQEALGLLYQKSTPSGSRIILLIDDGPIILLTDRGPIERGYDRPHQFSIDPSIYRPGSIGATYAEQALHTRQVAFFVDPVGGYSEDLARTFSQTFLANAYSGTATVYKELSYMLKQVSEQSSEIENLLENTQEGLER